MWLKARHAADRAVVVTPLEARHVAERAAVVTPLEARHTVELAQLKARQMAALGEP